jgi:glyoxylase-like metal-dependent hydrolase (beta-lactamase superfamily II)
VTEHRGDLTAEGELVPSPRRELDYVHVAAPEPGHAAKLADGLLWARIPLPMELNHINVWLLDLGDGWMLVDTGMDEDVCREAWHVLEPGDLGGRPLRRIFVTHDHPDHMGLSQWLHLRHDAPVWMSEVGHRSTGEFLAASTADINAARFAFTAMHGLDVSSEGQRRFGGSEHGRWYGKLPPLDRVVQGGDRVVAGNREWQVIETSGHCRGHLCLYDAAHNVLITGDQVLPTISPNVSVLASRPDANPLGEFLASLERLARDCAPGTLVLPSHGRPFHGLHARIDVLRSHHLQQLDALRAACTEPLLAQSLVPAMFSRPLRGFHRFLALGETVAHLNYLWHAGELARHVEADGRILFAPA